MKKRIPAIILMFALFLTTSYAANTYRKTITVTSGVNVEFNNEAIDMTDANGKAVEAFIYNGTTYVPIRAVSNAFGADIGYDRNTQTISIYDDFSEVCAVAHEMSSILSDYYNIVLMELTGVANKSVATSMKDTVAELDTRIDNMYDTFIYLTSEDRSNTNFDLLSESINKYHTAIMSCLAATQSYETFIGNQNDYNAKKFIDKFHVVVDDYAAAQTAISDLFEEYSLWRDLGF